MHVPALYDCQTPRYKAEHVPSKLAQAVPLLSSCKPPCRDVTEEYTETIYDLDVARVRDVLVQLVSEVRWRYVTSSALRAPVMLDMIASLRRILHSPTHTANR